MNIVVFQYLYIYIVAAIVTWTQVWNCLQGSSPGAELRACAGGVENPHVGSGTQGFQASPGFVSGFIEYLFIGGQYFNFYDLLICFFTT